MEAEQHRTTIQERVAELGYEHSTEDLQAIGKFVIAAIREKGLKVPRKEWREEEGQSFKVYTYHQKAVPLIDAKIHEYFREQSRQVLEEESARQEEEDIKERPAISDRRHHGNVGHG